DDNSAADGEAADGADHRGCTSARASRCGIRVSDVGHLGREHVGDGEGAGGGGWAAVRDGDGVAECGTLVDGFRRSSLRDAHAGLGGQSDDGGCGGGIIGKIWIADGARDRGSSGDDGAGSNARIYLNDEGEIGGGTGGKSPSEVAGERARGADRDGVHDQPVGTVKPVGTVEFEESVVLAGMVTVKVALVSEAGPLSDSFCESDIVA